MRPPQFAKSFDPDHGLVDEIEEAEARKRDRRRQEYVVAWPDRCASINLSGGTWGFHSLGDGRQRGYLAYTFARKTRVWRLSHLYVAGQDETYLFVEVPLWAGRAEITAAPFESPKLLDPPPEDLRGIAPPAFGDWDLMLSMPTDPREWIEIPDGFNLS